MLNHLVARFVWSTVLTVGLFLLRHLLGWA